MFKKKKHSFTFDFQTKKQNLTIFEKKWKKVLTLIFEYDIVNLRVRNFLYIIKKKAQKWSLKTEQKIMSIHLIVRN